MSDSPNDQPTTDDAPSRPEEAPGATQPSEIGGAASESLDAAQGGGDSDSDGDGDGGEDGEDDPAPGDQADVAAGDATAGSSDANAAEDGDDAEDADEDADEPENENPLDTEGEIAADYLEELLDIADLDGDIDTYVESDRPHISIVTDTDLLVGPNGEVLEALQELSRLAVMTETGHRSRLMLDVAGYRDQRRKVLVDLAGDAVQEVKSSGESVRLTPMNPFERKIVHDAVAASGLTSESEGEEPARRVVVLPSS